MLGLYNSVWHWYRPRGTLSLAEVEAFFVPRMLMIVGFHPDTVADQAADLSVRRLNRI